MSIKNQDKIYFSENLDNIFKTKGLLKVNDLNNLLKEKGFLMTFSNYQNPKTPNTENFLSKLSSYDNILDLGLDSYLLQDYAIGDIALRVEDDSVVKVFYAGDAFDFDQSLMTLTNHMDRLLTAFGVSSETLVIGGPLNPF